MTIDEYLERKKKEIDNMTLANARDIIASILGHSDMQNEFEKAVKMLLDCADKALEQEPCEDSVSRKAVLEKINNIGVKGFIDYNSYSEMFDFVDALPPVTPKQRWIPVTERLPERCKEVIVTDIETSDTYLSRYIGNGYWECDNGLFKNRIIAWMPLPEPYKEGVSE